MEKRLNFAKVEPEAMKTMYAFENYVASSDLKPIHLDLLKVRVSQINKCAFCIEMHTEEAKKNGVVESKLYLLNAWRESDVFDREERAMLALTEEITQIHVGGVSDQTYQEVVSLFNESYVAQLIMAIITINACNRIGVSTKMKFGK